MHISMFAGSWYPSIIPDNFWWIQIKLQDSLCKFCCQFVVSHRLIFSGISFYWYHFVTNFFISFYQSWQLSMAPNQTQRLLMEILLSMSYFSQIHLNCNFILLELVCFQLINLLPSLLTYFYVTKSNSNIFFEIILSILLFPIDLCYV